MKLIKFQVVQDEYSNVPILQELFKVKSNRNMVYSFQGIYLFDSLEMLLRVLQHTEKKDIKNVQDRYRHRGDETILTFKKLPDLIDEFAEYLI